MDCGTSMVKYVLFLFNTIVSIIGILAVVQGVYILNSIGMVNVGEHTELPPHALIPILLIVLGSVVVFISFLGCCGAIRESVCMTMGYAVCMLTMLILQLTVVILYWTNREKFNNGVSRVIDETWEAQDTGIFEAIQESLKCCGKDSIADYAAIVKIPPKSCCEGGQCLNPYNIYGGCRSKLQSFIVGDTGFSKYIGIGLIVVEIVGFIFACALANNVRNYKRRNNY